MFHNLRNYDSRFIFRELVKHPEIKDIKVFGQSAEKFIAIATKRFRFIDSYAHMPSSLDVIADNLVKHGKDSFIKLKCAFPQLDKFELLLGKGDFCYEYIDCV